MAQALIRILVVDDVEAFRRLIADILNHQPELQIVSEASDGLQALKMARQLRPDLVLLDISIPKLNGIEVARRISQISPLSRIIFISQGLSEDVVLEGLRIGATGFVAKPNLRKDLLQGVNAVLRGETFIRTRLAGQNLERTGVDLTRGNMNEKPTSVASRQNQKLVPHHAAGFYSNDSHLLDDVSQFVGNALGAGKNTIVIATEPHRTSLLARLQMRGLDMTAALEQGRYIALDADEALSTFMVDGLPDQDRFFRLLGDLIATVEPIKTGGKQRLVLFGECAQILWTQGNGEGALQLEQLGNQLVMENNNIDILCGYALSSFQGGTGSYVFNKICAEHTSYYSR